MKAHLPLAIRLLHEDRHGEVILGTDESNWGWNTPAGELRKERRSRFLTDCGAASIADAVVLEIGCGTGTFTDAIARAFKNLTCIDISEPLLATASKKHPGVLFKREDIHQTHFQDATFDLVLGCSVLHHLEWDLALREIWRILKPGGQLRCSEPNLLNPQIYLQKNWGWLKRRLGDSPDEYAFTPAQIRRSLMERGFVNIDVTPFEFLHPATPPALIPAVTKLEELISKSPLVNFAGSIKIVASRL
jgi:SAM-dependent methyltransferase